MTPPIFVISLAREAERRARMAQELAGFDFEFFDAVDGRTLDAAQYAHRLDAEWFRIMRGRELAPGEIGCFLSHYGLWGAPGRDRDALRAHPGGRWAAERRVRRDRRRGHEDRGGMGRGLSRPDEETAAHDPHGRRCWMVAGGLSSAAGARAGSVISSGWRRPRRCFTTAGAFARR